MAGLGFKDFAVGEVLTSADVDGYLMQQTVMRFADASARGSALGTATGTAVPLAEGMVSYLDDANDVQVYTGTAWTSVIGVKQVVYASTDSTTSTTGTAVADTALTATITPAGTANQILVMANFETLACNNSTSGGVLDIFNGTTGSTVEASVDGSTPESGHNISYVDSPASTSAVTYTARIRRTGAAATVTVSGWQTLILMEVAA